MNILTNPDKLRGFEKHIKVEKVSRRAVLKSLGIAGGLDPTLKSGDVVVADDGRHCASSGWGSRELRPVATVRSDGAKHNVARP